MCGTVLATVDPKHKPSGFRSKAKMMRQDPDPWYSTEFWQRAVIGILVLALAYLLASPAYATALASVASSSATSPRHA